MSMECDELWEEVMASTRKGCDASTFSELHDKIWTLSNKHKDSSTVQDHCSMLQDLIDNACV